MLAFTPSLVDARFVLYISIMQWELFEQGL